MVIGVLATVLGDAVTDGLRRGDGLGGLDHPLARWLAGHRSGWLTTTLRAVTTLGSPLGVTITVALMTGGVVWRARRVEPLSIAAVVLGGADLFERVVKALTARPRPPLALREHGLSATGFSFPSGHATMAAAGYGLIAVLLIRYTRLARARAAIWAAAAASAGAVGMSRLYLGAHWFSDVVAGWLVGAWWLGTVVAVASRLRRRGEPSRQRICPPGKGSVDDRA